MSRKSAIHEAVFKDGTSTYKIAGCVYRYPEPDDPRRPYAPPSNVENMRQWQLHQIAGHLVGLPIRAHHIGIITERGVHRNRYTDYKDKPASEPSIATGDKAMGKITHAWVDPVKGGLHFVGEVSFDRSEAAAHHRLLSGTFPYCSLTHFHFNGIIAKLEELSLCVEPKRPDTNVYVGDAALAEEYMRNNNYSPPNQPQRMSASAADPSKPLSAEEMAQFRAFQQFMQLQQSQGQAAPPAQQQPPTQQQPPAQQQPPPAQQQPPPAQEQPPQQQQPASQPAVSISEYIAQQAAIIAAKGLDSEEGRRAKAQIDEVTHSAGAQLRALRTAKEETERQLRAAAEQAERLKAEKDEAEAREKKTLQDADSMLTCAMEELASRQAAGGADATGRLFMDMVAASAKSARTAQEKYELATKTREYIHSIENRMIAEGATPQRVSASNNRKRDIDAAAESAGFHQSNKRDLPASMAPPQILEFQEATQSNRVPIIPGKTVRIQTFSPSLAQVSASAKRGDVPKPHKVHLNNDIPFGMSGSMMHLTDFAELLAAQKQDFSYDDSENAIFASKEEASDLPRPMFGYDFADPKGDARRYK